MRLMRRLNAIPKKKNENGSSAVAATGKRMDGFTGGCLCISLILAVLGIMNGAESLRIFRVNLPGSNSSNSVSDQPTWCRSAAGQSAALKLGNSSRSLASSICSSVAAGGFTRESATASPSEGWLVGKPSGIEFRMGMTKIKMGECRRKPWELWEVRGI